MHEPTSIHTKVIGYLVLDDTGAYLSDVQMTAAGQNPVRLTVHWEKRREQAAVFCTRGAALSVIAAIGQHMNIDAQVIQWKETRSNHGGFQ